MRAEPPKLAYLVANTITNVTTQDEQVECFRNVAAHLEPGGCFVIEVYVPELQRLPPGETIHPFTVTPTHLGFEEYDVASQIAFPHHYWVVDGQLETRSSPHRYVWPSELDLMARLAGMTLRQRWSNWERESFTSDCSPTGVRESDALSGPRLSEEVIAWMERRRAESRP